MKLNESLVGCKLMEVLSFTGEVDSEGRRIMVDKSGVRYSIRVNDSYGFDTDLYKDGKLVGYVNAYDGTIKSF